METPIVDLCFQVLGQRIPVDHGYALYSAMSKSLPEIHTARTVGVRLIRGRYIGNGLLDITPRSQLVLRMPSDHLEPYINLAGKNLNIDGHQILVGTPTTRALKASASLYSHIVTTKHGNDQSRFEAEIANQMNQLIITDNFSVGKRRTFVVHNKQVVGYSLTVTDLTDEDSISLQENGLGGRRKLGCGFFVPVGDR